MIRSYTPHKSYSITISYTDCSENCAQVCILLRRPAFWTTFFFLFLYFSIGSHRSFRLPNRLLCWSRQNFFSLFSVMQFRSCCSIIEYAHILTCREPAVLDLRWSYIISICRSCQESCRREAPGRTTVTALRMYRARRRYQSSVSTDTVINLGSHCMLLRPEL